MQCSKPHRYSSTSSNKTGFFETPVKCAQTACDCVGRCRMEKSDHRHRRLLRVCRERPRCRAAAKQRDELAPFHCQVPPVLSTEGTTPQPRQEAAALRDFNPAMTARVRSAIFAISAKSPGINE
jgi:hypothetical protein